MKIEEIVETLKHVTNDLEVLLEELSEEGIEREIEEGRKELLLPVGTFVQVIEPIEGNEWIVGKFGVISAYHTKSSVYDYELQFAEPDFRLHEGTHGTGQRSHYYYCRREDVRAV